jgi:aldehyde dehydrogenase (NAD+)
MLQPKGLVLALLPWDNPVLETVLRLVPAILAGNSILLKNSKDTPLIADFFEEAF